MASDQVRVRSWIRASDEDARAGLLGYITVFVGRLIVDGVTVRRTAAGKLVLSFPQRESRSGHRHAVVRPVDDEARREIEAQVLGDLLRNEKADLVAEDS
jgi:DNA-binding cell septation regulator SpoVG